VIKIIMVFGLTDHPIAGSPDHKALEISVE
jgi:hypothetical protein